jgi:hypothetical protein
MPNLTYKPNYRLIWSQGDLARLKVMLAGGSTIPEIAKAMGCSQEAVRNRARTAGLLKKRVLRAPLPQLAASLEA